MAVSIASQSDRLRLSLGPVQYHWSKEKMLDFYRMVETSPVDIVYLGETVCSKRRSFRHTDWIAVADRLQAAGKEVVLSTLALIEANSELGYVRKLCENGNFKVEANDMSAVQMLAGKTNFIGGSPLNIYNPRALRKLIELGMTRCVIPIELSKSVLTACREEMLESIEFEVLGWGRLPLAYSARCYTARAHKVSKDDCGNCCIDYPDGLMLTTREEENFLVFNGIQTQSAKVYSLIHELNDPARCYEVIRISPQSKDTEKVIALFDRVRSGHLATKEAVHNLQTFSVGGLCDGYWHGDAGMTECGEGP